MAAGELVRRHPTLMNANDNTLPRKSSLDGLPFQDEEFDFVHVKRISRGVPEDKVSIVRRSNCPI